MIFACGAPAIAEDMVRLADCLGAVAEIKTGQYVKVEFLSVTQRGGPTYEFEVLDAQGREWELMCSALTGRVYEIEQEVESPADPLFRQRMKITGAQARRSALRLYPGKLIAIEYEIESNGDPTYELDIVDAGRHQFKIEVSAITGEVIEVHVEDWEIGMEPGERPRAN
ncbi:MAG: PepSY domain-containing protein [Gammaproteobacteria bacterium]|nr:PepSY domain-containing protein [Gammaproteobacteria bacterium]